MFKSAGKHLSPSLVISCLALFIALGSVGYSATGGSFILGKSNSANKTTQLSSGNAGGPTLKVTNTGGRPAAAFITKPGKAPFTVNRNTTVTKLSADLLDGLDSTAFALAGGPAGDATTLDGLDSLGVLGGTFDNVTLDDGAVTSAKVLDDNQAGGGLSAADLATNSVAQAEIATDGVAATEIQNDSIDAGEIVDFGLTNQDIGVLFAEVSATAVLDNHSGGVTVTRVGAVGAGQYEVDFGRNIALCTAVATIGLSGAGAPVAGQVYLADRSGNAEAVFVDTNDSAGAAADRAFRLVVVC
jgi:hypothetical protein